MRTATMSSTRLIHRIRRRARVIAVGCALGAVLGAAAVSPATYAARGDAIDLALERAQSLLTCTAGRAWPTSAERVALRAAGVSLTGFAHDGGVLFDDRHDTLDDWAEMRIRFPHVVTLDGNPVTVMHLSREQSGDTATDYEVKAYAETQGALRGYAASRRLAPLPGGLPPGLEVGGNDEDRHLPAFQANLLRWSTPLSARQIAALGEPGSVYLPGPHRLPALRFAGALPGAADRFAFGCMTFGPDVTPVDGA